MAQTSPSSHTPDPHQTPALEPPERWARIPIGAVLGAHGLGVTRLLLAVGTLRRRELRSDQDLAARIGVSTRTLRAWRHAAEPWLSWSREADGTARYLPAVPFQWVKLPRSALELDNDALAAELALSYQAGKREGVARASRETYASWAGVSVATIKRGLGKLRETGRWVVEDGTGWGPRRYRPGPGLHGIWGSSTTPAEAGDPPPPGSTRPPIARERLIPRSRIPHTDRGRDDRLAGEGGDFSSIPDRAWEVFRQEWAQSAEAPGPEPPPSWRGPLAGAVRRLARWHRDDLRTLVPERLRAAPEAEQLLWAIHVITLGLWTSKARRPGQPHLPPCLLAPPYLADRRQDARAALQERDPPDWTPAMGPPKEPRHRAAYRAWAKARTAGRHQARLERDARQLAEPMGATAETIRAQLDQYAEDLRDPNPLVSRPARVCAFDLRPWIAAARIQGLKVPADVVEAYAAAVEALTRDEVARAAARLRAGAAAGLAMPRCPLLEERAAELAIATVVPEERSA